MNLLQRFEATFQLPEDSEEWLTSLGETFDLGDEPPVSEAVTWYDTFDWRLHGAGLRLSVEEGRDRAIVLRDLDRRLLHRGAVPPDLGFARTLPSGPLRRALEPLLAMRRLLPLARVQQNEQELRIEGALAKTVVRLRRVEGTVQGEGSTESRPLPRTLEVRSVVGYPEAFHRVETFLEGDLELERLPHDAFRRAVSALGREPGDYSSKTTITLEPQVPAGEAARQIHRELLGILRLNEEGTRRDLDSEFLHDFRVAVRRTRSALGQVRGVLPAAAVAWFKQEFAWLGRATGPTRDLDVYLLKFGDYRGALPPSIRPHLDPLADFLEEEQRRTQRELSKLLDGARYRRLLADWERFLDEGYLPEGAVEDPDDAEEPPAAARPILEVARKRIWKSYRRVIRKGSAITDDTPAEALHEVRIDAKKLRYLMEFFRSLFPAEAIDPVIKSLKRLQDLLGDFNDFEVQQDNLGDFAHRLARREVPVETLLAIGRLQEHLARGQDRERKRFAERFARFAEEDNEARFRALFKD
jgi:CHAD domain-containing protein